MGAAELSATRWIGFDGRRLETGPEAAGRGFMVDARCLAGDGATGAFAHVCALADEAAQVPFDDPAVQQVRRDALAWWIPRLGDSLVCVTMLALDESHCGGAITVARRDDLFGEDPFARLFPGTVVPTDLFGVVDPPVGPVMERYAGAPWPGGGF